MSQPVSDPRRSRQRADVLHVAASLGTGLVGATLAQALGLPLPYLLGSLFANAALSILLLRSPLSVRMRFPQPLRMGFVSVIGAMIGTTFDPDLIARLPGLWATLLGVLALIACGEALGYIVYRHLGGYDRPTAFYAAMPGGLVEAVSIGEQAGGDPARLSLQHFVRIVLVVVAVPALFTIWTGHAVGSAAGMTLAHRASEISDWLWIVALAPAGGWIGRRIRLPAGHLTGPLLIFALLHGLGVLDVNAPPILMNAAQLVVGAGLGANFAGTSLRALARGFGLGVVAVSLALGLAYSLAALFDGISPMSFHALFLSYAPGGVTEMSLVALSLGINPILVAAHHLFRIVVTVSMAAWIQRRLRG